MNTTKWSSLRIQRLDAFSSHVIPVKVEKAYMGEHINVMTQALQTEDSSLLQGLTMQNAYTELRKGSKNSVMVVRNSTAYPQTLEKKTPVVRVVAATALSELPAETRLQEGADEPQGPHTLKLTVRQRQRKLFKELDLSGLESWPQGLADSTQWL